MNPRDLFVILVAALAFVSVPATAEAQVARCYQCTTDHGGPAICEAIDYSLGGYAACEEDPASGGCIVSGTCQPTFASTDAVAPEGAVTARANWGKAPDGMVHLNLTTVDDQRMFARACNGVVLARKYTNSEASAIRVRTAAIVM